MMKQMRFLVVGAFESPIHEPAFCKALEDQGILVEKFEYRKYFRGGGFLRNKYNNFQKKFRWGPLVYAVNRQLRQLVEKKHFDCIFFYRPVFIKKPTMAVCAKHSIVYVYNNDDPFSKRYNSGFWKDYFDGLTHCTRIFYYRNKNRDDYSGIGYKNTTLLRSYFIRSLNYPLSIPKKYDVVFVGHYEDDGRDEVIRYLMENGINIKLFGPEWHRSKIFTYLTERNGTPIVPLGKEYNTVINEAKIAIVFLSTLNCDTYTRRCFEIPAAGTFMLSQYSDDLASMFEPGRDADYFNSKEDLLEKVKFYLSEEPKREQIALQGYQRVETDGHEVTKRVMTVLNQYHLDIKKRASP